MRSKVLAQCGLMWALKKQSCSMLNVVHMPQQLAISWLRCGIPEWCLAWHYSALASAHGIASEHTNRVHPSPHPFDAICLSAVSSLALSSGEKLKATRAHWHTFAYIPNARGSHSLYVMCWICAPTIRLVSWNTVSSLQSNAAPDDGGEHSCTGNQIRVRKEEKIKENITQYKRPNKIYAILKIFSTFFDSASTTVIYLDNAKYFHQYSQQE